MALSIVAESNLAADAHGITKSTRWFCDVFSGTAEALVVSGLLRPEQLNPQKGRPVGHTAFLPTGELCPPTLRAWRDPGFKAVRQLDDGTFCVEVTVHKDVQKWRRTAEKTAKREADQAVADKEIVENGHKYRNWKLQHGFGGDCEHWEGTKQQLQAEGLCIGMAFPGETGVKGDVYGKCPLGFEVRIYLPTYDHAKAAAGIYTAQSWYLPRGDCSTQYIQHANGVRKKVWADYGTGLDVYLGTAEALVGAGLVPDLRYFPGQPGANKVQASYLKNWTPATTASNQDWGMTLCKLGKSGEFSLEVPAAKEEIARREAVKQARADERTRNELKLAAERKQLRQSADQPEQSAASFRAKRVRLAEFCLELLSSDVFARADGSLSFDIRKDGELSNELAGAFQVIRDAVQNTNILRGKKQDTSARTCLKLVAARNGTGLQSSGQNATLMRLVPTASTED